MGVTVTEGVRMVAELRQTPAKGWRVVAEVRARSRQR
jgi:hypothetical protein